MKKEETALNGARRIRVKIRFVDECLGTASANRELHAEYIASNAPDALSRKEEIAALGVEEYESKQMTVFPRTEGGDPFFWDYQIRGFFKDCCSALQRCKDYKGAKASCAIKAYKKIIDGCIFVEPRQIRINMPKGGEIGDLQRPLRAQTPQGERVALARSETIPAGSTIEFEIITLSAQYEEAIFEWLNYGRFKGIGQWRNAGKGRFTYEIVK